MLYYERISRRIFFHRKLWKRKAGCHKYIILIALICNYYCERDNYNKKIGPKISLIHRIVENFAHFSGILIYLNFNTKYYKSSKQNRIGYDIAKHFFRMNLYCLQSPLPVRHWLPPLSPLTRCTDLPNPPFHSKFPFSPLLPFNYSWLIGSLSFAHYLYCRFNHQIDFIKLPF